MMFRAFVLSFAFLACEGRHSTSGEDLVKDDAGPAITEFLHSYYEAMSARDWEAYRNHFWKNATITTVWQQPGDSAASVDITTIEDFIKETSYGPDSQPIFEERMEGKPRIYIEQNIAQARARYTAKFGTTDSLMQWTGTDVFTLLRHDGEWKIVSVAFEAE